MEGEPETSSDGAEKISGADLIILELIKKTVVAKSSNALIIVFKRSGWIIQTETDKNKRKGDFKRSRLFALNQIASSIDYRTPFGRCKCLEMERFWDKQMTNKFSNN